MVVEVSGRYREVLELVDTGKKDKNQGLERVCMGTGRDDRN